jgi:hypothetical protein
MIWHPQSGLSVPSNLHSAPSVQTRTLLPAPSSMLLSLQHAAVVNIDVSVAFLAAAAT